ncbi:uncharacterized protein [Nicotiana tomentosiformis]|uniref:uncharacterized protein n=1 Tax=Nicotiana tomentosiformis TaxID=4098 RepID=UPI00388CBB0D
MRDLNLRHHRWLELLKDYDITILHHPGKVNIVADALSRKAKSMGSLTFILAEERPFALNIQSLANRLVRLDISEPSRVLACIVDRSSLLERIKARQYDDLHLLVLKETLLQGGAKEVTIREYGVLRLQGRLCVPNVDGLREKILHEAHSSRGSLTLAASDLQRIIHVKGFCRLLLKVLDIENVWRILCVEPESIHKIRYHAHPIFPFLLILADIPR